MVLACATSDAGHQPRWVEPSFITNKTGVLVSNGGEYLTPEMADELDQDLLEVFAARGCSYSTVLTCLLGVHVVVNETPVWRCRTLVNGESRDVACVGETDGKWWARIGATGRCAYACGKQGPPYEHELAHIVANCLGWGLDWDHKDPIWAIIDVERPCP